MTHSSRPISFGRQWRYRLEIAALTGLGWLVRCLPHRTVHQLGRATGWLAFQLAPRLRRIARANLEVAFGDTKSAAEKRQIACASLQNSVATMFSLFWSPRLTRQKFGTLVDVEPTGLAQVRALAQAGRPIVFVTAHYGDWELLGLSTGFLDIPVTVVQQRMRNAPIAAMFEQLRRGSGHTILPNRHTARKLLTTLHRGGSVAFLIDLNSTPNRGGVWLDFFGLPVFNSAAAGALALHTGAAIVPGLAHPLPGGRSRLVFGPVIEPRHTGAAADDQHDLNQRCLSVCEQAIRQNPGAWLWHYRRWKYRAPTDPRPYPFYAQEMHWR